MMLIWLIACIPDGSQGPVGTDYVPDTGWPTVEPTGCVPDDNPALSQEELLFDPAVRSRFRGESAPVDASSWDYSGGTVETELAIRNLSEFWFEDRFSGVTHVAALDLKGENWGIYRAEANQLFLLGVASNSPNYTALSYSPAVTIWQTPLAAGDAWNTQAEATGIFEGDEFPYDLGFGNLITLVHDYAVNADGAGEVKVDAGLFEAQRLSIHLEAVGTDDYGIEYGRASTDTRLFLAPCTGLVARGTDQDFMGLGL